MYNPSEAAQMTTAMRLQTPIKNNSYGVNTKTWKDIDGVIWANFKTYGGTEKTDNDILTVEDTANLTCRYNPDIKSDCRLIILSDGAAFEILGEPENIEMRNMFLKFKVRRVKGGA